MVKVFGMLEKTLEIFDFLRLQKGRMIDSMEFHLWYLIKNQL